MPLRVLYVDFNSYFASVEQQMRPELRGRPVAVVPVLAETTCCIAASYEAKRCGVKTGTLVSESRKLCPDIRFVEARQAGRGDRILPACRARAVDRRGGLPPHGQRLPA